MSDFSNDTKNRGFVILVGYSKVFLDVHRRNFVFKIKEQHLGIHILVT